MSSVSHSIIDFTYRCIVSSQPVLYDVSERIATVTLNRPESRNALDSATLRLLPQLLLDAENSDDVDVVVLTGVDPAFCAGLDLRELGDSGRNLDGTGADGSPNPTGTRGPFPKMDKPLIAAVNGAAVTGGLELVLNADFVIASERAKFGDTHARVGVMPGWGMSVLLPQAVGIRRAREMSFTGNFMDAIEALQWGLVNHVVPHEELIPRTRLIARDIIGNDQSAVRSLRRTYADINAEVHAWDIEARDAKAWRQKNFDPSVVAERRSRIIERGRNQ
jgi:enoyl-CoA hydratase